ncbi:hypothetical protein H5410_052410 [Solanum commersonii]|uniref:Reverse transcriptase zinc-binding domain-containing protein n=1 Tax=Solanum commersonii TaxID=4109 RepID=A0A9J5X252_SOLCO|nr:hypothetical protein H5410_052410 [Solanum commersonii]
MMNMIFSKCKSYDAATEVDPKKAVWIIRKILKAKETAAQVGYNHEKFVQSRSFWIKTMYNALRGNLPKVSRERLECNNFDDEESTEHLFFQCTYLANLWRRLKTTMEPDSKITYRLLTRGRVGYKKCIRKRLCMAQVYKLVLSCSTYYVWQERNYRVFQNKQRGINELCKTIVRETHCRGSVYTKVAKRLQELNYYP